MTRTSFVRSPDEPNVIAQHNSEPSSGRTARAVMGLLLVLGSAVFAPQAFALGTAVRVKDINPTSDPGASSGPSDLVAIGDLVYFAAYEAVHGRELWRSDGTPSGTRLVKDILEGPLSYSPTNLVALADTLFFVGGDPPRLWKSDGTEEGTVPVEPEGQGDLVPITGLIPYDGRLYFFAYGDDTGAQLWRSDGTPHGTVVVKGFGADSTACNLCRSPAVAAGKLFMVLDGASPGLWVSDGTEMGTRLVVSLDDPTANYVVSTTNDRAFLTRYREQQTELWASDGTPDNNVRLFTFVHDFSVELPAGFVGSDNRVFFSAGDSETGRELWTSDGTPEGTHLVVDLTPGSQDSMAVCSGPLGPLGQCQPIGISFGGLFYFIARVAPGISGVWKTDGSAEGTSLLVTPEAPEETLVTPHDITAGRGGFFFMSQITSIVAGATVEDLWRSDGSAEGTGSIARIGARWITEAAEHVFFAADDGDTGEELWRSDLTPGTAMLVSDIYPRAEGSNPCWLHAVRNELYFIADDGAHGVELWKSDGSDRGTKLVRDIVEGSGSPFYERACADDGFASGPAGIVYFRANDGHVGLELWRSDGTEDGTHPLKDIYPGPESSFASLPISVGGLLYFLANDGLNGFELWKSDGTEDGTRRASEAVPGAGPYAPARSFLFGFEGSIIHNATYGQNTWWRTDAVLLEAAQFIAPDSRTPPTIFDGQIFFGPDGGLWRGDGRTAARPVKEIADVFGQPAVLSEPTVVGNRLFFGADRSLWESDGTETGTHRVPLRQPEGFTDPFNLTSWKDDLYFLARSNRGLKRQLFHRNIAKEETTLVKYIGDPTGVGGGASVADILRTDEGLIFAAADEASGLEPWISDGTDGGTIMAADIVAGPASSDPRSFTRAGRLVFFSAGEPEGDRELWALPIGTVRIGCVGDCDGNGVIAVSELVRSTNILLGKSAMSECTQLDGDHDGQVALTDLVAAVWAALEGCD